MANTIKVRIYTCDKHPNWSLESTAPVIASGLKVFCPLCRDEFLAEHIGLAEMRIEERERRPSEADAGPPAAASDLFK